MRPQFQEKKGGKTGFDFLGTLKTLFLTLINQINIKSTTKTTYSYTSRRDLLISA
jgi:hypothetical protein